MSLLTNIAILTNCVEKLSTSFFSLFPTTVSYALYFLPISTPLLFYSSLFSFPTELNFFSCCSADTVIPFKNKLVPIVQFQDFSDTLQSFYRSKRLSLSALNSEIRSAPSSALTKTSFLSLLCPSILYSPSESVLHIRTETAASSDRNKNSPWPDGQILMISACRQQTFRHFLVRH